MADAQCLVLRATSILKLGIIPSDSLTSAKSNSELVHSLRNLLAASLSHDCNNADCHWSPSFSYQDSERSLFIPKADESDSPDLSDTPRDALDVTAKLFCLQPQQEDPVQQTTKAVQLLEQAIGLKGVDLLILQSPDIHYEADQAESAADEKALIDRERRRYNDIAALPSIGSLGLAEFSLPRLKEFFSEPLAKPPKVDQVNLRDCCSVSSELTDFVQKHNMDLLVHSDLSNLLPAPTFLSLLDSFKMQLPESIRHSYPQLKAKWVLKYTVLYKHRSVVADKGYIVFAQG